MLALQGAFKEHAEALQQLGFPTREVRLPAELRGLKGVILPGDESTVMRRLLTLSGLHGALRDFAAARGTLWGTYAGAIVLAQRVDGDSEVPGLPPGLGLLDVAVQRNAYGRQLDSFTAPLQVRGLTAPFEAYFIRAPAFTALGSRVEVLASYEETPVLVKNGALMASTFHPELANDGRIHQLFLEMLPAYSPTLPG